MTAADKIIEYFTNHTASFGIAVLQHLEISIISVLAAGMIAFPLGLLCARSKRLGGIITGIFASLRIVPSLAVLLICVPLIGIGMLPSVIALCFLALPPLLINTTLAFSTLSPAVLENAEAMGMNSVQVFFRIKLPLALPLILAGLKTAVTEVIASATLAAYIGGGGLGTIIFTGFGLMRNDLLIIGGASVAFLSLSADLILTFLEYITSLWKREPQKSKP